MLDKTYKPAEIEPRIHEVWEQLEAFKCGQSSREDGEGEPFCIVIPPPNVTGSLHMGHALNNTLQDVLCRFERMRGRQVLWQPGTDHAGIATQMVVERQMMEHQEPGRREIGREKFLEKVWKWKDESGGQIVNQLKRLGASCDWSRERFTMDEGLSRAVLKVFVTLYREGLIYKDKRLVNWDPKFQSAISDLEVVQVEASGKFKWTDGQKDEAGEKLELDFGALNKQLDRNPGGHMFHFRYPLKDDPARFIIVATTRPETMLGDTGVAVHPEDERYSDVVGKKIVLPLVGREIPIVADEYSDPEKGTGAVKITPAHDFNDFEVGQRQGLQQINVLDAHAGIIAGAEADEASIPEAYRGLDRFVARKKIVEDFYAQGLLERIEPTTHQVPHGDRSNEVIEPWLTDQWYVDAETLARPAIEAVETGATRFVPKNWEKTYFEWMRNIQPWCISRQLWWGHQIPAWYGPKLSDEGEPIYQGVELEVFVARDEQQAKELAVAHYSSLGYDKRIKFFDTLAECDDADSYEAGNELGLFRDPDVLDTWFSSALWPFSTLGWPETTPELAKYYPTSTLITGFDIIFFWIARMMMMGLHFQKEVPFHDVYIHALVRDAKGQKMSKSKGNVMDPLEIIDKFGADALRFTLAAMAAQGRDIKLSTSRVEGYRNFATKLWNASRFAEMNECVRQPGFEPADVEETLNQWIASETQRAANSVTASLESYKFNEGATAAYEFVWGVFCDWYLELIKPILSGDDEAAKAETRAMVAWVLDQILKLLHPFMPFITEELWAHMVEHGVKRRRILALSQWPDATGLENADADAEIGWVISLVSEIRSVRTEMNIPAGARIPLMLTGADAATRKRADRHEDTIKRLARLDEIKFAKTAPKGAALLVVGKTTAAIPLKGLIDMDAEKARLGKEIAEARGNLDKMNAKLDNPNFVARARPEAVDETRERKAELEGIIKRLDAALKRVEVAG